MQHADYFPGLQISHVKASVIGAINKRNWLRGGTPDNLGPIKLTEDSCTPRLLAELTFNREKVNAYETPLFDGDGIPIPRMYITCWTCSPDF